MTDTLAWALAIPLGYLIGAIPTGYLIGRMWRGVDIRKYGSGGTGFTNVMRTLGKPAAFTVLGVDVAKGSIPVLIAGFATDVEIIRACAGSTAVIGHVYPVYTRFEGGRGVATAFGALAVLSPIAAGAAAVGLLVIAATRYVSAGSLSGTLLAAASLVVMVILRHHELGILVFAAAITIFIPIRHAGNIERLVRGQEHQIATVAAPRRRGR
jgi:glycerol-3-phosphate acyltransferase PlsY